MAHTPQRAAAHIPTAVISGMVRAISRTPSGFGFAASSVAAVDTPGMGLALGLAGVSGLASDGAAGLIRRPPR
jgi:hypothetical protein